MSTNGDCGFAASITLKNGRVIYAADYGYKAFPLHGGKKKSTKKKG